MANTKSNTSRAKTGTKSRSSATATASTRNSNSRSSSARQKASMPVNDEQEDKESVFVLLAKSKAGRLLYGFIAFLVIIGFDFLVSMNHYGRFFVALGFEIIFFMIVGWLYFVLHSRKKANEDKTTSHNDDVTQGE